jgi:hypothetical protein
MNPIARLSWVRIWSRIHVPGETGNKFFGDVLESGSEASGYQPIWRMRRRITVL